MSRQSFSHLSSGTVPYIMPGSSGVPVPPQSAGDVLATRDGDNCVIINVQDFSVYRSAITHQTSLSANIVSKLDQSLEGRRAIAIANLDSTAVLYIGFHPEVTVGNGWPIFANTSLSINCSNKLQVYGVSASNIIVSIMEVA